MSRGVSVNVLQTLQGILQERRDPHLQALTEGSCKDFAEYRFHAGVLHGLAIADRELQVLDKRIEDA